MHAVSYSGWIAGLISNIISFTESCAFSLGVCAEVSSPTWGDDEHPFTWSQVNSKVDGCSLAGTMSWYPRSVFVSIRIVWKLLFSQLNLLGHPSHRKLRLLINMFNHGPFSVAWNRSATLGFHYMGPFDFTSWDLAVFDVSRPGHCESKAKLLTTTVIRTPSTSHGISFPAWKVGYAAYM